MDPNAALESIRESIQEYEHASTDHLYANEAIERLVEHFEALDGWLGGGGMMPDAWWTKPGSKLLVATCTDHLGGYILGETEQADSRKVVIHKLSHTNEAFNCGCMKPATFLIREHV